MKTSLIDIANLSTYTLWVFCYTIFMITYEKALELKNAGFPQKYQGTDPVCDFAYYVSQLPFNTKAQKAELHLLHYDNDTGWWIGNDYGETAGMTIEEVQKDWVKCPTLSELIEACGTIQLNVYADARYAQAFSNKRIGDGSKPEEAVAQLYLELNKK